MGCISGLQLATCPSAATWWQVDIVEVADLEAPLPSADQATYYDIMRG